MKTRGHLRRAARWLALAGSAGTAVYATYAGITWCRYGHPEPATGDAQDPLLDRFMPSYEVVERHHLRIGAPAEITLDAAKTTTLFQLPLIRAIFKGRELILGATPSEAPARGLLAEVQALGWVVLAEIPGREIVVGAVTKPWEPNVTFRSLAPDAFLAFAEPDYVKIAWTLRADPVGAGESIFRTETRVIATDPAARARFRRYWALLSPGIIAIRRLSLAPVRAAAERRAHPQARGSRERAPGPKHVAIIQGHPDPNGHHFCHALADAYAAGAREGGHEVAVINVARLDFPLPRRREDLESDVVPDSIRQSQEVLTGADHVVMIFPLWNGAVPALLKGFLEQTFRSAFVFPDARPDQRLGFSSYFSQRKGLAGRSGRLVATMQMPAMVYRWFFHPHPEKNTLRLSGIGPIRESVVGLVETADSRRRQRWLVRMRTLGKHAR